MLPSLFTLATVVWATCVGVPLDANAVTAGEITEMRAWVPDTFRVAVVHSNQADTRR